MPSAHVAAALGTRRAPRQYFQALVFLPGGACFMIAAVPLLEHDGIAHVRERVVPNGSRIVAPAPIMP